MNLFQLVVCPALALLCVWEIARLVRGMARHGAYLRISVWLAALACVAYPQFVQQVANLVGIGRGTDIVLYAAVLTFLLTSWWFYAENHRLRRDVTELIRLYAIDHAMRRDDERGPGLAPTVGEKNSRPISPGEEK